MVSCFVFGTSTWNWNIKIHNVTLFLNSLWCLISNSDRHQFYQKTYYSKKEDILCINHFTKLADSKKHKILLINQKPITKVLWGRNFQKMGQSPDFMVCLKRSASWKINKQAYPSLMIQPPFEFYVNCLQDCQSWPNS